MRVSLNEIKKLVPEAEKVSTDELVKLIGSRLVEVEEKIDLAPKYQGIKIVKVVECEAIPETHLHVCKIDAGEKDLIQVVCGAPNVRKDMLAVWIAPGCIVPETYGGENFKLSVRPLRGFESHGMLSALDELDLGEDHAGIIEIDPDFAKPGDSFAEKFDLNDIILDIENKSLTHRPDTFGLIGFAREVAGILGVKFNEPTLDFGNLKISQTLTAGEFGKFVSDSERVKIEVKDEKLCPRYSVAVFSISSAGLSTATDSANYLTEGAIFLAKAGMRTINKIVDATNISMLLTGQPLHAFDYDKFKAVGGGGEPKITVRSAKSGETLKLLDDSEIELNETDIVICSGDTPVALAGAMGGESTEIDANTKKIILESATFSLYNLRKTQMAHGIFSEAITRFTKGQPVAGVVPALARCASMLLASPSDIVDFETSGQDSAIVEISITKDEINSLLGTDYSQDLIEKTLKNVGINYIDNKYNIPAWRTDIHIKEDLIEEVGRLLGYDNIALDFPTRPFIGAKKNPLISLKSTIRDLLSNRFASHELLTYSFVSRRLQESVGENPDDSYEIVNSISPELQRFRQSIIPSLLEKVSLNLKAGFRDFSVYEFNQVSKISFGRDEDGVPHLKNHLAFVTTGDYYSAKAVLLDLLSDLGIKGVEVKKYEDEYAYLEPLHSASVIIKSADGKSELTVSLGEIKSPVLKRLKISGPVSAFELDLDQLLSIQPSTAVSAPEISRFPSVERDLTVKVSADLPYADLIEPILSVFKAKNLIIKLDPTSIYQSDKSTKNISFHLRFASSDKTLGNSEISDIMEEISKSVGSSLKAEIV
ncbi:phenylalanine--tRNA ligase subunit beta [Candidatus Saccharibacteria bacterium]|nr:phenylalanine--tRNA ligase subunit beta [Candidatus Saccharibacteria bacterium]